MKTRKTKKGISLIVLVITIIVMIILAAAIVITLSNSGIINKANEAVDTTNLKQVQELAQVIWAEGYLDNKDAETIRGEIEEELGTAASKYNITVTDKGVEITAKETTGGNNNQPGDGDDTGDDSQTNTIPESWQASVTAIVDGVPIPKGFVASSATGENTKAGGLVIYEGTAEVTDANVETARFERNQYVWVPVDKTTFDTTFVRRNFGLSDAIINTDAALGTSSLQFWEVVPTTEEATNNLKYMVQTTTLAEVQAMYASVEKYGGFYIARYEAGINSQRTAKETDGGASLPRTTANVHSKMGKIPYTYIPWTWNNVMNEEANGAVEVARGLYPNNATNTTGVISTLTYGVQWDTTVEWFRTNGKDINGNAIASVTNSTAYGNYQDHKIVAGDLNKDAKYWDYSANSSGSYQDVTYTEGSSTVTKSDTTSWALSTGALKVASVNNIYDMAGNMFEWTMEGRSTDYRARRGGYFNNLGAGYPVAYRNHNYPSEALNCISFRPSLYIK